MRVYYNEFDKKAAAWLRELIAQGLLPPGDVDERDIRNVQPADLAGYVQHHFFAGIGGWPLALRIAGWPDDRPAWTGSCPCPPFSAAGKGQRCPECGSKSNICHPRKTGHFVCLDCGCDRHADERHLWPEFARLIREYGAPVTFGEQVASADGRLWLGAVRADLETMGRSLGGADLCAAGVGAPNIRQRLWFVTERTGVALGDAYEQGLEGRFRAAERAAELAVGAGGLAGGLADAEGFGRRKQSREVSRAPAASQGEVARQRHGYALGPDSANGIMGHGERPRSFDEFWRDADWLFCRDERWRPVESGTFPLAHGVPARVVRLRGYGNAINPYAAAAFIRAWLDTERLRLTGMSRMEHDGGVFA